MKYNKTLYFFLVLFFNSFSLFSQQKTFIDYCKLYKQDGSNPGLDHTLKILFKISGKKSIKEAFKTLKKLKYLDLSNQEISDLAPLAGLTELRTLDISHNNLKDLWGLESLSGLERLIANDNQISNIAPLASLKKIEIINLENNQLEYVSPLKELCVLKTYLLKGNPFFQNESEKLFLNGIIYMRGKYKEGIPYQFNPDDSVEDLEECLMSTADRGDFVFYRSILANQVIAERLLAQDFLKNTTSKVKKIILAVMFAKDIASKIIKKYEEIENLGPAVYREDLSKLYLVQTRRKQLESFFEFYLAEGDFFPYNYEELKSLEKKLLKTIRTGEDAYSIHPRYIQKCVKLWEESLFNTGIIPGKIATGFNSM